MKGIIGAVAITWLLTRVTALDKGWLWFCCVMGVLGEMGHDVGMIGLLVAAGVFKVARDVCSKGGG